MLSCEVGSCTLCCSCNDAIEMLSAIEMFHDIALYKFNIDIDNDILVCSILAADLLGMADGPILRLSYKRLTAVPHN